MASPRNPPSGDSAVRREQVARLLQDGLATVDPTPSVSTEAAHLQALGVIHATTSTFVQCSDPRDSDFSRSNHQCRGRIYVPEQLDESSENFFCSECDRPVFPVADGKLRRQELLCRTVPSGVFAYVKALLDEAELPATSVCNGVMRIDAGPLGVFLCIADLCREQKFLMPAWAATQPTCYILVNAKAARRCFGNEMPPNHILLADVICGNVDLRTAVRIAADSPPSASFQGGFVLERLGGPVPHMNSAIGRRRFEVAFDHDSVWVEGLQVISSRAGQRLVMFRLLWESFLEDLHCGKEPEQFRVYSLEVIRLLLESRLNKRFPDELTVRRMINRVQATLAEMVRRELGLPITRKDIVETCVWKGQKVTDFGYRLNPACVVAATVRRHRRRKSS